MEDLIHNAIVRKKQRIALIVALVVGLVILLVVTSQRCPVDPLYQGRKLSSWLDCYPTSWTEVGKKGKQGEDQQRADEAIRVIHTNAFPLLLDWLVAKDGKLKNELISFANNHPKFPLRPQSAVKKHMMALRGFQALGTNMRGASARLIEIANSSNPETREQIMMLLSAYVWGPDLREGKIKVVNEAPLQPVPR